MPLLTGYVFLAGDQDDGYAAICTKRVCQIITVADQERLIDELQQIREALDRGAEFARFGVVALRSRAD